MKKQNQKRDTLTTWGWGWGQGEPSMVISPRWKDPTVSQKIMTLPQSQAWYPSSFHCEQGQKVGLCPWTWGEDIRWGMSFHPPGPGENHLFNPIPLGPKWSPHFPCIRTLSIPCCPHILPLGLREGFLWVLPLSQQINNDRHCTALLQCLPWSLRCAPSHLVAPPAAGDLTPWTFFQ